jgi:hypothetical protein
MLQRAVDAIDSGRVVRAVTNANVAPDSKLVSGVSGRLAQDGIVFIDVFPLSRSPASGRLPERAKWSDMTRLVVTPDCRH